jgi:hypothetical protein
MKFDAVYKTGMKAFVVGSIVMLSTGCVPYHKLLKSEFPQGERVNKKNNFISNYLQETRVYEEFSSVIEINALWFSNEVRREYTQRYCDRRGKDNSFKNAMLRRELEENKHWITFYVLVATSHSELSALSDVDPYWTLSLALPTGEKLSPELIKEVDLNPEVRSFFGDKYNPFKRAFLVRFPLPSKPTLSRRR